MLNSDQRRYILAIITALLCERINIVWFPLLIPLETERRKIDIIHVAGLTSTQYAAAWVSSSFLAVCFLKFGARRSAYNLVIGSCSLLCFTGLATAAAAQIGADITFLFALYVLAIGKGVFSGAVFSAINTVAITEFKDFVQQVKAIASIAYIVGCIISIVLASAALDIAGIWASCIATAVFGLIFLAVTIFIMPSLITVAQSTPKTVAEIGGSRVRKLLSLPELIATLTTHSACFALMSASGTGLAPFLRNTFDLSSLGTGVVSSLSFLGMALGAVVWAHVGQKFSSRRVSTLWTALALGALSCFVGPDPWMCSLSPSIIITTIGLCMGGFLLACQHVSNAEELRIMALARGFSSGMETGSALGSLLAASEDVSGLVGPVVGALLNREWGFPRMMTLTGFAVFIFGFARMVILIFQDCRLMRLSKLSAVTI